MSSTAPDLLDGIADFGALMRAARRAVRGKRGKPGAAAFIAGLETEVLRLERELQAGIWKPGRYVEIEVFVPKHRLVSAAPFRDRVVHHALCAVVIFEQGSSSTLMRTPVAGLVPATHVFKAGDRTSRPDRGCLGGLGEPSRRVASALCSAHTVWRGGCTGGVRRRPNALSRSVL
jgi:hypothetical protein